MAATAKAEVWGAYFRVADGAPQHQVEKRAAQGSALTQAGTRMSSRDHSVGAVEVAPTVRAARMRRSRCVGLMRRDGRATAQQGRLACSRGAGGRRKRCVPHNRGNSSMETTFVVPAVRSDRQKDQRKGRWDRSQVTRLATRRPRLSQGSLRSRRRRSPRRRMGGMSGQDRTICRCGEVRPQAREAEC
eukprot:1472405-Pleurochrysis_carterae.AAC.2